MKAMVLEKPGQPLVLVERPDPLPGPGQIRLKVEACARLPDRFACGGWRA